MKLTLEQVRHVATLARLRLTPDEETLYQQQLSAVLEAVEQLSELDVSGVEATAHASLSEGLLRDDAPLRSDAGEKVLAHAPERVGTSFAVPKIIE